MSLGTLFWYKAGEPSITATELREHARRLGMGDALPGQILPIDVFRRITGPKASSATYTLGNRTVTLSIEAGRDTQNMLRRVITRTRKEKEESRYEKWIILEKIEVADFVFYMPPRGELQRSKIRSTLRDLSDLPDKSNVERFIKVLRKEYRRGLDFLDAQGIRRLVRAQLALHHALPIDEVYLVPDYQATDQLCELLGIVGGARGHQVRLASSRKHLALILDMLTEQARRGRVTAPMLERYESLLSITIPAEVRRLVEGDPHEPTTQPNRR